MRCKESKTGATGVDIDVHDGSARRRLTRQRAKIMPLGRIIMAVNGNHYDWESLTATGPHGEMAGINEITYEDSQEVEARYGRGSIPRGYGRGNYEASGSMVLDRDEWEKLKKELVATGGGIYDHQPFNIVISYGNDDMPTVTDTLKNCKITKFSGGGGSQGDSNVSQITCEFIILSPILWNGTPAKRDHKNWN